MAPSAWDQVLTGSQRAGYKLDELVAAGLIQKGRQGGHYDRFRNRITFPIRDQRGRVLGFGARALSADSKPKYLNSPEGELYRKSNTLYGIDQARGPIAKARRAILVEGYTDVLALHQAGVEEAVAIMGTAITPEQLSMLAGLTDSVVLALDADSGRGGRDDPGAEGGGRQEPRAAGGGDAGGRGSGGHASRGRGRSLQGAGGRRRSICRASGWTSLSAAGTSGRWRAGSVCSRRSGRC